MSFDIPQTVYDAVDLVAREYGVDGAIDYLHERFHTAGPEEKMRVAAAISAFRQGRYA